MGGPAADALARAGAAMAAAGVDALLIGPGADLRYLVGYHAPALERLTLLVVGADGRHALVVPRLERPRAQQAGVAERVDVVDYDETDDPFALVARLLDGSGAQLRLGVGDRLWSGLLLGLQAALPEASWVPASAVTRELRMRKSPAEVDALRRAARAIDRVHSRVADLLRPGRSEADVGRDIADLILAEGHDAVNFVIVGSGPNGASPHHESGRRRLRRGDAVVVDIGGTLDGYCSDCTRDYVLGSPPDGYPQAHAALEAAQRAACEAVRPGVTAAQVDAAARRRLAEAGLGQFFVHRTGHGIGLEEHEDPYIVAGNELGLEPGMAFSIEPGVYLPQRFGMRIEDIVVVSDEGCERLNRLDRAAVVV
ncbi:MAG TPA: Xaa-Pro peptidase family protein [Egibacteraceae bacterium]|nr:Xaa-Pro peptidase family protein [Egibacteraceae bacterium]